MQATMTINLRKRKWFGLMCDRDQRVEISIPRLELGFRAIAIAGRKMRGFRVFLHGRTGN